MNNGVTTRQILQLYRNLLKYGKTLELTDKEFYFKRVKKEFESNKHLTSPKEIEFLFQKGQSLLENKRIL